MHQAFRHVIGQNAHDDLDVVPGKGARDGLEAGIDEIGTHAVSGLEGYVKLIVIVELPGLVIEFNVPYSPSALSHIFRDGVGAPDQVGFDGVKISDQAPLSLLET